MLTNSQGSDFTEGTMAMSHIERFLNITVAEDINIRIYNVCSFIRND